MTNDAKFKRIIEARLTELRARMKNIETTLDEPSDSDLEDQAIELEDDEVLEGLGRASIREAQLLEDALNRIANGLFGICQKCGDEVSEARLEAVPYALLCRNCANATKT